MTKQLADFVRELKTEREEIKAEDKQKDVP